MKQTKMIITEAQREMLVTPKAKNSKAVDISKFKNVHFTSDTHFDDDRLNLFSRDILFSSAEDVDDCITERWNENVNPGDLVIHVGDVALTKKGLDKVHNLNGTKWLVQGNYDTPDGTAKFKIDKDILSEYFDKVFDDLIINIDGEDVFINHYPTNAVEDMFNIVGHIHGTWKVQRNMINVGTDAWHLTPVPLKTIKFQMNGIRKHYDQNVFAGEINANLNHRKGELIILRAPEAYEVRNDDVLVFLAGPIQGSINWQENLITKLEKEFKDVEMDKNLVICNPRRDVIENFVYEEQVDWESNYLDIANKQGVAVFWLPKQDNKQQYDKKDRSYGQTTRFELGELFSKIDNTFSVGVQPGFHGEKYIKYKFKRDHDYDIVSSFNKLTNELTTTLKNKLNEK